jgi:hypothetical protein
MEKLPDTLNTNNKDNFKSIYREYILNLLRKDIFLLIVSRKSENEYFDLDKFASLHLDRKTESLKTILDHLIPSLENLGWKCKYSFADTGLFIYSTDNPPPSCW